MLYWYIFQFAILKRQLAQQSAFSHLRGPISFVHTNLLPAAIFSHYIVILLQLSFNYHFVRACARSGWEIRLHLALFGMIEYNFSLLAFSTHYLPLHWWLLHRITVPLRQPSLCQGIEPKAPFYIRQPQLERFSVWRLLHFLSDKNILLQFTTLRNVRLFRFAILFYTFIIVTPTGILSLMTIKYPKKVVIFNNQSWFW